VKACVLCGETEGQPSIEDVIPNWAVRAFDLKGPLTLYAGGGSGGDERKRVVDFRHLKITLDGTVCDPCNTRYLSRIENDLARVLTPMMLSAERTKLDPAAQALLATWAVKTVYLFELAIRQHYPDARPTAGYVATEQELAWLRAKREPPPRSLVWLTCWDCQAAAPVTYEPSVAALPTGDGRYLAGHMTTFALGYVAFQVFTVDFVAAEEHGAVRWNSRVPRHFEEGVVPIWPGRGTDLSWPSAFFAHDDWNRLVTWDGALRPGVGPA
jgi:hypothetical protein